MFSSFWCLILKKNISCMLYQYLKYHCHSAKEILFWKGTKEASLNFPFVVMQENSIGRSTECDTNSQLFKNLFQNNVFKVYSIHTIPICRIRKFISLSCIYCHTELLFLIQLIHWCAKLRFNRSVLNDKFWA